VKFVENTELRADELLPDPVSVFDDAGDGQAEDPSTGVPDVQDQFHDAEGGDVEVEEHHDQPAVPQVQPVVPEPRYPRRDHNPPVRFGYLAEDEVLTDPQSYEEAMSRPDAKLWSQAMDEEMKSLMENKTWDPVDSVPKHARAIPVKWIFKIKRDAAGTIDRYKARLVAKGFMQRAGVDFDEVYAPVSKHASLRALLSVVAAKNLELHQMDVKTAFLHGELEEEIYTTQAPGYETGGQAYRLNRALYGLKQAPRAWYNKLHKELEARGFQASQADPGLYVRRDELGTVYLLVYVDDTLVAGSAAGVAAAKAMLESLFAVHDLGEARYFLGMELTRDRAARTLVLSQTRYTKELIARFGVEDAKVRSVPMHPSVRLSRAESAELSPEGMHYFSEVIGSLLYLSVCTRPDISFSVGALSRYMSKPCQAHLDSAMSIVRYLKGTVDVGLKYGGEQSELLGYCDADFAGDIDTRKSTTGFCFLLNGAAISWASKLQPTVAVSTAEAEYMAAAHAVKEALWLHKLMCDLGIRIGTVQLMCDNQAALSLLKHPIASARSKHIDVIHHFARERVARGEVMFKYCATADMAADGLTKALADTQFQKCRKLMGIAKY
jgi:hypothetical protein